MQHRHFYSLASGRTSRGILYREVRHGAVKNRPATTKKEGWEPYRVWRISIGRGTSSCEFLYSSAETPVIRQCRSEGWVARRGTALRKISFRLLYTGLTPKTRAADLWTSILNGSWNCLIFHVRQRVHGAERISEGPYPPAGTNITWIRPRRNSKILPWGRRSVSMTFDRYVVKIERWTVEHVLIFRRGTMRFNSSDLFYRNTFNAY